MYGRQRYTVILREARATTIQRYARGWMARKRHRKVLKAIILLQCCVRRMRARRELKQLKVLTWTSLFIVCALIYDTMFAKLLCDYFVVSSRGLAQYLHL